MPYWYPEVSLKNMICGQHWFNNTQNIGNPSLMKFSKEKELIIIVHTNRKYHSWTVIRNRPLSPPPAPNGI
jgi:hypothetical protein